MILQRAKQVGAGLIRHKKYCTAMLVIAMLSSFRCRKELTSSEGKTTGADTTQAGKIPMRNMFGVNGYEWNILMDPANPDASKIYEPKLKALENFTALRHYMDWEKIEPKEGGYTFNPTHSGSWNYDAIYQRAAQDSILMLSDLKTVPKWFLDKYYPADMRDGEDVPAPYGSDRSNPASYILQAKAAFQFAARYGFNANVNPSLVTVDTSARWTADPPNEMKIGLRQVKYIECDNERDKTWKGAKAHQSPQEYAANMSAFYDGHKGKLGKGVGVKAADPNMQVVMGGLATNDPQYVKDMIEWCRLHRGYRADGSIDVCFDVINNHFYANEGNGNDVPLKVGIAPELSRAGMVADGFIKVAMSLKVRPEVWVTECGYDTNPGSPQRAQPIGNRSILLTQGDWSIRTCLLFMRHGINRLFFYQMYDDTPGNPTQYATSGLINADFTRRPAADYMLQVKKLMGNYVYKSTISADPLVDKFVLNDKTIYALTIPDQKGRTGTYQLDLGKAAMADVYTLKAGADAAVKTVMQTANGKLMVKVSETPVFVQAQ